MYTNILLSIDIFTIGGILSNNNGFSDKDMLISLRKNLNNLKEREREVLVERYIIGKTQMELAEEIGISQAQISRLEKSGLENIKKMIL